MKILRLGRRRIRQTNNAASIMLARHLNSFRPTTGAARAQNSNRQFNSGRKISPRYLDHSSFILLQERQAMFSRRDMLAATAVGGAMTAASMTTAEATPVKSDITFGNPNDPPQGAINAKNPRSVSDPGPQNPVIRDQFPGAFSPPPTDIGSMPL